MTDRELFKHALGVLDQVAGAMPFPVALEVRAALRERLAQPDAYGYASRLAVAIWEQHYKDVATQWKPLDDLMGVLTQIDNMTAGLTRLAQPQRTHWEGCEEVHPECRKPEQEPVAWVDESVIAWLADRKGKTSAHCTTQLSAAMSCEQSMPIYTTPPRREWVGLTDEEIYKIDCLLITNITELVIAIEANLKEKNT